nr:tetratricopeptide repeat protein [Roseovarius sp.]
MAISLCAGVATPALSDVAKGIEALEAGNVQGAATEFQSAFETGDADGAFYLGRLFEMGLGTEKDMRRAAELYAAAVSKQSALAQNRLGLMHLNGEFVLQDYQRAAELICAAADQGEPNGQFNCGLLYSQGKGVAPDAARAVGYWQEAAKANHVAAINYLGQAYQRGTGIDQDATAAFATFQRTAAAGNPMGLHELAKAYASGRGVDRDLVKAHGYANLAAVRGLDEARLLRDELAGMLDAASLEMAQAFARDWKAVPLDQAG